MKLLELQNINYYYQAMKKDYGEPAIESDLIQKDAISIHDAGILFDISYE